MRPLRLTGFLMVILALVSALVGCVDSRRNTPASQRGVHLWQIKMVNENIGWGVSDDQILRTVDGGAHWKDVTPGGTVVSEGSLVPSFVDANNAWVGMLDSTGGTVITVFQTVDGGRTWQKGSKVENRIVGGSGAFQVHAINAQNGWLMLRHAGMGDPGGDLFASEDGGAHWTKVSLPFAGRLAFLTPASGWVAGFPKGSNSPDKRMGYPWFYRTQDGGQTWQHIDLPVPGEYRTSQLDVHEPRFFTANDGILPVTFFATPDGPNVLDIYVTHDGGVTWTGTKPVPSGQANGFLDTLNGWVLAVDPQEKQSILYRTQNGGHTWDTWELSGSLAKALQEGGSASILQFATPRVGWVLGVVPERSSQAAYPFLMKTTDGGHTWTLVDAQLVP